MTVKAEEEVGRIAIKIYVLLLESDRPLGVRDLARQLNLPASTVHYHIKKLEDLDVVKASGLGYTISNPLKLEDYMVIGRTLVPVLIIYSFFFLGIAVGEALLITMRGWFGYDAIVALVSSLSAFAILFYEGYRLKRRLWR